MCRLGEPSPALRRRESTWEDRARDRDLEEAELEVDGAVEGDHPRTRRHITNNTSPHTRNTRCLSNTSAITCTAPT